jgi:hypothetical protein
MSQREHVQSEAIVPDTEHQLFSYNTEGELQIWSLNIIDRKFYILIDTIKIRARNRSFAPLRGDLQRSVSLCGQPPIGWRRLYWRSTRKGPDHLCARLAGSTRDTRAGSREISDPEFCDQGWGGDAVGTLKLERRLQGLDGLDRGRSTIFNAELGIDLLEMFVHRAR